MRLHSKIITIVSLIIIFAAAAIVGIYFYQIRNIAVDDRIFQPEKYYVCLDGSQHGPGVPQEGVVKWCAQNGHGVIFDFSDIVAQPQLYADKTLTLAGQLSWGTPEKGYKYANLTLTDINKRAIIVASWAPPEIIIPESSNKKMSRIQGTYLDHQVLLIGTFKSRVDAPPVFNVEEAYIFGSDDETCSYLDKNQCKSMNQFCDFSVGFIEGGGKHQPDWCFRKISPKPPEVREK